MTKKIEAISFLHRGERTVVKVTTFGKFKVPVSEVIRGSLKTRLKSLTARQVVEHEVIKKCDPTLYLLGGEKVRVFHGGDPSYLPAHVDGIIAQHDSANKVETPKPQAPVKSNKVKKKAISGRHNGSSYNQASIDMYGWYPGQDDGFAD